MPPTPYVIRPARPSDVETIVDFTLKEAREAEHVDLDRQAVRRGVLGGFAEPPSATYWVAETTGGDLIASTSIVREWSNFNGGWYWWIQSVFIAPDHRGHGLAEQLLEHLTREAAAAGALDLRLYVHASNARATRVYERGGFRRSPYVIMAKDVR